MTNDESAPGPARRVRGSFVIRASSFVRHSSFVIRHYPRLLALLVALLPIPSGRAAAPPRLSAQQLDFFEKRIRPVFIEHCYKCHSSTADKVKAGLHLDSRDGVLKGGESGPAIVPGNLERSLLIKAVRYKDKDTAMPPGDKKLPLHIIADLEQWVRMGAPDPRDKPDRVERYEVDKARAKNHWAFQPLFKPVIPSPKDPDKWCVTPIDHYVLAKLYEKSLTNSPRADKITLLRRASYNLTGLPPTIAEVDEFLADTSGEAFAKVVDRLLNSPRYGERWARHWLDIARYADTKGRVQGNQEQRFVHSHTYRDWVIRAFNDDMPYDRFVQLQLAADRLAQNGEKQNLPALGYITLGNRFGGNQNDIIDDRIDVVAKGLMGMTVTCARCHDHKFDPIPTADYYSMHGIFSSSVEPAEGVELESGANPATRAEFQKAIADAEKEESEFRAVLRDRARVEVTGKVGDYLLALAEFASPTNNLAFNQFMQRRRLDASIATLWRDALKKWETTHHPVFTPWIAYTKLPVEDFAAKSRELAPKFRANNDPDRPLNAAIARGFTSAPMSLAPLSAYYQRQFAEMERRWIDVLKSHELRKKTADTPPPEPTLADASQEQMRRVFYDKDSPLFLFDEARVDRLVQALIMRDGQVRMKLAELRRAINTVKSTHPGAPPRAVVLNDRSDPRDSNIFIKGNQGSRGPVVPRRFLEVLSGEDREPFRDGSGRLELAKSIATADNPLTARVIVNRIWQHQFGEGLVRTPDDFGLRSEPPTHPELLDYLAWKFIEDGWSIKKLQRHILLSAAWQQASDDIPRHAQLDPDNKWLWQQNRRRLDFEALRDTLLHIGGKLDLTMGGPGVRLDVPVGTGMNPNNPDERRDTVSRAEIRPYSERRSIYGFIDRANVGNMFVAFDFANPDLSTGRRNATIIPQQALFMMNSPLVIEQAMNMVNRDDFKNAGTDADRIKLLYRLIYSRPASDTELRLGLEYLALEARMPKTPLPGQSPWEYGWGSVDTRTGRTGYFWPMAKYTGVFWQAGQNYPDVGRYRNLHLSAQGGVPGPTPQYAAIRRWTATDEGIVSIEGSLSVRGGGGSDGVQGRIVSSFAGVLGTFVSTGNSIPTRVPRLATRPGDTIDFVVDCRANDRFDVFTWAPVISLLNTNAPEVKVEKTWDAQRDFAKPSDRRRLTTWQKLAQVILETNELSFVN